MAQKSKENGLKNWRQTLMAALGGLLGAGLLVALNANPRGEPVRLLPPPTPAQLTVHITGAVESPGVYVVAPGSRIQDAVSAAGGFMEDAAQDALNLAKLVSDGQQIYVPKIGEPIPTAQNNSVSPALDGSFPININTAGFDDLQTLPGIGPVKARSIITYRIEHNEFTSIEEIMQVPGIGPTTFESLKNLISTGQ